MKKYVLSITPFGTALALPVDDKIVKVIAVHEEDPSYAYVRERIVKNDLN